MEYETSKYNMQRPLSFVNWPTTDTLSHPNEPLENEDLVTVNTEHIKSKDTFKTGLFASYHIYPYYPDFMNYEHKYTSYKDDKGKINTYEAYLKDLIKQHAVPVLVGEFGVPSSRGMTHKNIYMDYNQGNIDEKYIYFMSDINNFDFDRDTFIIPIDITPNSGNTEYKKLGIKFERPVDYIIQIKKNNLRIMVDPYYDVFYYQYAERLNMFPKNKKYLIKNNGLFNPINLCLNRELYLPKDRKTVPIEYYETGKLKMGDGNPTHKDYNSLTDYAVNNNYIEIRIPWQLLNVMDPSSKKIMNDFYKYDINPMEVKGFYVGGCLISQNSNMKFFNWNKWDSPTYNERLKPSYYILKNVFKNIGKY